MRAKPFASSAALSHLARGDSCTQAQFPYHHVLPMVSSPRGWNQGYSEPCQLLEFPLRGRGELGALPSSWAVVKAEGSPSSSMTEQLRLGSHMVPTSAIPNVSQVVAPHRSCQSQREGVSPGDSTDAAVPLSHLIPGVPHTGSYRWEGSPKGWEPHQDREAGNLNPDPAQAATVRLHLTLAPGIRVASCPALSNSFSYPNSSSGQGGAGFVTEEPVWFPSS